MVKKFNPLIPHQLDDTGTDLTISSPIIGGSAGRWLTIDSSSNLFQTQFWVDVKAYGATGDGSTDDTTAIQAAIDSLASTGGTVFFPIGIYIITNITVNNPSVTLRGNSSGRSSKGSTLKAKSSATGAMIRIYGTSGGSNHYFRNGVYDLLINGNSQSIIGLQLDYLSLFRIENVEISGTADDGLKITQCFDSVFEQIIIRNINGTNKAAIRILSDATDNSNNLRFNDVHLESNTDYDVIIDDVGATTNNHIIFLDGKIEGGSGPRTHAVLIQGTKNDNIYFLNNRFTNYENGYAIRWDSSGLGDFIGNVFTNTSTNSGTGIDINGGAHSIRENFFFNFSTDISLPSTNKQRYKLSGNRRTSDTSVSVDGVFRVDDIYKDNAVPTEGTWARGSYILDQSPTLGAIPGWVCTTSGTPGTWAEMVPLLDASRILTLPVSLKIGEGGAGVDYDFLTVDGQSSDLLSKWYEDEKTLKINSDSNTIGMVFGNPSSDLFTIIGTALTGNGINGAGFSSENEAAFFLESKGNTGILGGSVYSGLYNNGSAVTSGQLLCGLWGGGYDTTTDLPTAATINMKGSGTWTSTSHPSRIEFSTTPSGSTTLAELMRLTSYGRVQIGDQSGTTAYDGTYTFFPTPDTLFQVTGQVTSVGSSFSNPFDILKLVNVTSVNFNPSANSNSGVGVTVYGGAGFNAFATGTHNLNGGLDIGAETISIVGAFGQFANKQTSTNTLDGAVGVLFTAAHYGYGGVGDKIFGAIFSGETSDDAGNGSVSGSQSSIYAAKFITRVSGVNLTTGVSGLFIEPYAYDQSTGVGVPTLTNKSAIDLRGTISPLRTDQATAANINSLSPATSYINFTGSTATNWNGTLSDIFEKILVHKNGSTQNISATNESGSAGAAAQRWTIPTGATYVIPPGGCGLSIFDTSTSRRIPILPHYTGQTYAASNVTTDRTYDANATTVDELADVLGTLISDLRSAGVLV